MNFFWLLRGLGVNTSLLINTSLNGTVLNCVGPDCAPQNCVELRRADWCTGDGLGLSWRWAFWYCGIYNALHNHLALINDSIFADSWWRSSSSIFFTFYEVLMVTRCQLKLLVTWRIESSQKTVMKGIKRIDSLNPKQAIVFNPTMTPNSLALAQQQNVIL